MATVGAKAKRRANVEARLGDLTSTLADRMGVTFPEPARPVRDAELAAIVELERQADILDLVLSVVSQEPEAPLSEPDEDRSPDKPDSEMGGTSSEPEFLFDRDEMKTLTLKDLKAMALDAGVDAEVVEKMRSKDEVIDAIEAQVDFSDESGGGA